MDEELGDPQWELIAPLLPKPKRRGKPRAEDRRTLNGILWVLRSGARWKDLPPKYGRPVHLPPAAPGVARPGSLGRHPAKIPQHFRCPS
jgi:transposase